MIFVKDVSLKQEIIVCVCLCVCIYLCIYIYMVCDADIRGPHVMINKLTISTHLEVGSHREYS